MKSFEKGVELFKKEAAAGKNPEVKALAAEGLPKLEQYLAQAKHLQAKFGK